VARASIRQENDRYAWEDLDIDVPIPDDVLDKHQVPNDADMETVDGQVS